MKKIVLLIVAGGCLVPSINRAMDLKQAKFTQVVNNVNIVSASDKSIHQAVINDDFKMPDLLRTGPDSRAELVAADNTITRVGANTLFSYDPANRTIDLQQGSLLFHSPAGKGGGTIRTGSATASVIGTTIIVTCTPNGGFKLLDLEGQTEVRFLNGLRQQLEPGQMTFILPGGTQPSPIIIFRLDEQTKGSLLINGFGQPLPSIGRINAEITQQLQEILNNQVGDTGLLVGNNATPSSVQVFQALNAQIKAQASQNNNTGGNNAGGGGGDYTIGGVTITASGDVNIIDPGIGIGVIGIYSAPIGGGDVGINGNGDIDINNYDISVYGSLDMISSGNIDIENTPVISYGDSVSITAPSGSVTLNGDTISGVNNVGISASGDVTINNSLIGETRGGGTSVSISSGGTLGITGQDGNTGFGYDIGADNSISLSGVIGVGISDEVIQTLDGDPSDSVTISSVGIVSF